MKCERNGSKLVFTFDGLDAVTFDQQLVNSKIHFDAEMHGYEQKIRDNAAIARKQKDGTVITVTEEMRRKAVLEMVEYLYTAETWNIKGPRKQVQNPTILAIAAKRGCSYAEAEAFLANQFLGEMA